MNAPATSRRFWEGRASALARRINVAAWLLRLAPAAFFVASAFAILFYALRRVEIALGAASLALAGAFMLTGLLCWWRARRSFYSVEEARVLLESHLRLDTRLTAAALGLTGWPAAVEGRPVVQWRLRATSGWLGGAAALLAVALLAPIPRDTSANRPAGGPPALLQAEEMLASLQEMNVAEPQALEQFAERAQELARRPGEEQYSHSALEAADALRNQIAVSAAGLARNMDSAANAMRAADGADVKDAANQLSAALGGMRGGNMPARSDLLSGLPGSALDLKNLSAEQRAAIANALANAAAGLKGIAGAAGAGAPVARPGPGGGRGNGGDGEGDGFGYGTGRGGGHAPLALNRDASDAGDGLSEALTGDALKRFALGDKLGTSAGAHDADPTAAAAPMSAGAISGAGSGGDAVWVNRLTPTERAALKQFFK